MARLQEPVYSSYTFEELLRTWGDKDYFIAYHGSHADFGKFSLEKVSTGEGGTAHGYGVYLSFYRDVSEMYAEYVTETKRDEVQGLSGLVAHTSTVLLVKAKRVAQTRFLCQLKDIEYEGGSWYQVQDDEDAFYKEGYALSPVSLGWEWELEPKLREGLSSWEDEYFTYQKVSVKDLLKAFPQGSQKVPPFDDRYIDPEASTKGSLYVVRVDKPITDFLQPKGVASLRQKNALYTLANKLLEGRYLSTFLNVIESARSTGQDIYEVTLQALVHSWGHHDRDKEALNAASKVIASYGVYGHIYPAQLEAQRVGHTVWDAVVADDSILKILPESDRHDIRFPKGTLFGGVDMGLRLGQQVLYQPKTFTNFPLFMSRKASIYSGTVGKVVAIESELYKVEMPDKEEVIASASELSVVREPELIESKRRADQDPHRFEVAELLKNVTSLGGKVQKPADIFYEKVSSDHEVYYYSATMPDRKVYTIEFHLDPDEGWGQYYVLRGVGLGNELLLEDDIDIDDWNLSEADRIDQVITESIGGTVSKQERAQSLPEHKVVKREPEPETKFDERGQGLLFSRSMNLFGGRKGAIVSAIVDLKALGRNTDFLVMEAVQNVAAELEKVQNAELFVLGNFERQDDPDIGPAVAMDFGVKGLSFKLGLKVGLQGVTVSEQFILAQGVTTPLSLLPLSELADEVNRFCGRVLEVKA
jgi:hypothetical protein